MAFDITKDQLYQEEIIEIDELNQIEIDSTYPDIFYERWITWTNYFQDKISNHLNIEE